MINTETIERREKKGIKIPIDQRELGTSSVHHLWSVPGKWHLPVPLKTHQLPVTFLLRNSQLLCHVELL